MITRNQNVKHARYSLSAFRQLCLWTSIAAILSGATISFAAEQKDAITYPALPFVSDYVSVVRDFGTDGRMI